MLGRDYPRQPLVGVGAVVLRGKEVLLVRRGTPPRQGIWTFPGGLVELGERLFDAAQRELWEETGLHAKPLDVVDVYEIIERDEEGRIRYHFVVVEILFLCQEGTPRAASDASAVRWVSVDALGSPGIGPGVAPIVRKALRLVNLLQQDSPSSSAISNASRAPTVTNST